MHSTELISIIIVNWNGRKWLKRCLDSLAAQTYKDYEIIFVDNNSQDGSVKFVKKNYPFVNIVLSSSNLGFAGGNNLGYKHSHGEYVLLLNNDTWVEPGFLSKFRSAFDRIPNLGSVQSKLILMDNPSKLDVVGSYWTNSTHLYHYGLGKDGSLAEYNEPLPVFSNKGASMLISRKAIERVGLFDDDFWCYYEETDLCHRLWLAGYECWYYPDAVAHHALGGTSLQFDNAFIQFHNFKNKLLSFLKNFSLPTLLIVLPIYLMVNIALSFFWLAARKPRHCLALYQSFGWNIGHFGETLRKRKRIQKYRKRTDQQIFRKIRKNPRLAYYQHLLNGTLTDYED